MSLSETYCILPFIHIAIGHLGKVQPCCLYKTNIRDAQQKDFNVASNSLDEIWMSEELETLRKDLLDGKMPEGCSRCWTDERLGVKSKRIRDNDVWKRHYGLRSAAKAPHSIDLSLGNLCNLKCRICSPISSSKFGKEAFDLFQNFDFNELQNSTKWPDEKNGLFWQGMEKWLSSIEHFDIYGGEPFLSKPHFLMLEQSVKLGFSKNQTLHYNTNGTIFPEKMVKEIWPHFKSVNIMFSIDGVGSQFEYQRYPAAWDQVERNILEFKKYNYLKLDVCFTVNAMNIWNFPDFYSWANHMEMNYWINYLYDPIHFRAQIFPDIAKKEIEDRLRQLLSDKHDEQQVLPIIPFMWDQSFTGLDRKNLMAQLEIYDGHRKQSFKEVFPEAYNLLTLPD